MKAKLIEASGLALVILLLLGCGGLVPHRQPAFIGRWDDAVPGVGNDGGWIEFTKDGEYKCHNPPFDFAGRWRHKGRDEIEVVTPFLSFTWRWKMDGAELVLIENGEARRLRRVIP